MDNLALTPWTFYAERASSIVGGTASSAKNPKDPTQSFFTMLERAMSRINEDKVYAGKSMEDLSLGRSRDVHSTVVAMERADMEFRLLQQVRNKLLDGYNELFRMSV